MFHLLSGFTNVCIYVDLGYIYRIKILENKVKTNYSLAYLCIKKDDELYNEH